MFEICNKLLSSSEYHCKFINLSRRDTSLSFRSASIVDESLTQGKRKVNCTPKTVYSFKLSFLFLLRYFHIQLELNSVMIFLLSFLTFQNFSVFKYDSQARIFSLFLQYHGYAFLVQYRVKILQSILSEVKFL